MARRPNVTDAQQRVVNLLGLRLAPRQEPTQPGLLFVRGETMYKYQFFRLLDNGDIYMGESWLDFAEQAAYKLNRQEQEIWDRAVEAPRNAIRG